MGPGSAAPLVPPVSTPFQNEILGV
jgi:hypothetical protein